MGTLRLLRSIKESLSHGRGWRGGSGILPDAVAVATPVSGGVVERSVLEDLAAASRILVDQGVFDAAGHVSMRHPRHAERFLMSRSLAPELVTADDIIELTLACEVCDTRGGRPFIE